MSIFKLLNPVARHQLHCRRFAASKRCPEGLRKYYLCPMPDEDCFIDGIETVSLDFETTGLNPESDFLLSAGGISIIDGRIDFSSSFHFYVRSQARVKPEAAVVNHIRPEALASGRSVQEAVTELLDRLSGRAVLTHCSFIETGFLRHLLGLKKGDPLPFIVLDTMAIERRLNRYNTASDVRLFAIRRRRGLPDYEAHNALADSLSAAEVFLSQLRDIFGSKRASLKKLLSYL